MRKHVEQIPIRRSSRSSPLRVAAYCRVSTGTEEQEHSLESQIQYYTDKIYSRRDWVCVGVFADTASGLNTKDRPEFLKLMQLCRKKKVDLIITKSVSRFGRNTLDSLKAVRRLQLLDIDVWFETEGLRSLDGNTQPIMEILTAFAQRESESKSKDIKWGIQQSYKNADSKTSHFTCYGYTHDKNGYLIINEEEAEVVRLIFKLRVDGYSLRKIVAELEQRKISSPTGRAKWSAATLDKLLSNEKYVGEVLLQKTFIENVFSGAQVKNIGQQSKLLIQNHHEPIVNRVIWDMAQKNHKYGK